MLRVTSAMRSGGIAAARRSCTSITRTRDFEGTSRCMGAGSAFRQIIGIHHESLDARTRLESVDDRWHVGNGHTSVEEVIGLDENGDACGALVEAARGAGPGFQLGETSLEQLLLESLVHRFGALGGAR